MNGENIISVFRKVTLKFGRMVSQRDDSEDMRDALQEAFLRVWSRRESLADESHAEGLLTVTARNLHIDSLRRRSKHSGDISADEAPEKISPPSEESVEELYNEIDTLADRILSPRDKEILYHRDKDGWDFDELAQYYDLSVGNVRMIVSRARNKIRMIYNTRHNL